MILLSRKGDEALFIGEDIVIKLTRVAGGRALIGMRAPKEVKVLREEIAGESAERDGSGDVNEPRVSGHDGLRTRDGAGQIPVAEGD